MGSPNHCLKSLSDEAVTGREGLSLWIADLILRASYLYRYAIRTVVMPFYHCDLVLDWLRGARMRFSHYFLAVVWILVANFGKVFPDVIFSVVARNLLSSYIYPN